MDPETLKLDSEILQFISGGGDFNTLALKVFAYQFKRNLNYRKFCSLEGKTPASVKRWEKIPAMPSAGFKELVLATFPVKKAVKIFKTSGTTGRGTASATKASADAHLRGAHFFDTLKLYEAAIVPAFRQYLLPDGGAFNFCFLIDTPQAAPHSSLSYMMGVVNRVFAGNKGKFYIRKKSILNDALARDIRSSRKKVFLLSTAFSLKSFLDHLEKKKIRLKLPKGSRLMETGGFKGKVKAVSKRALYSACEDRLGIPKEYCVSEYGMTELSSQFYDTTLSDHLKGIRRKPFKTGPAWMRTLVIDPKTGKEARKGGAGILRHFDLANRGSVMAVQTEDLGRPSGDGFELLGRASDAELRGCSLNYEKFLEA